MVAVRVPGGAGPGSEVSRRRGPGRRRRQVRHLEGGHADRSRRTRGDGAVGEAGPSNSTIASPTRIWRMIIAGVRTRPTPARRASPSRSGWGLQVQRERGEVVRRLSGKAWSNSPAAPWRAWRSGPASGTGSGAGPPSSSAAPIGRIADRDRPPRSPRRRRASRHAPRARKRAVHVGGVEDDAAQPAVLGAAWMKSSPSTCRASPAFAMRSSST
jgi:hypothetical protein